LEQLLSRRLSGTMRTAVLAAFFEIRDTVRDQWQRDLEALAEEMVALDGLTQAERTSVETQPKKWTAAQREQGLDKIARRAASRLDSLTAERREYRDYAETIRRLLDLQPSDFDPGKFKIDDLIPRKSLGPKNSIGDLQHYVAGPAVGGLVLA